MDCSSLVRFVAAPLAAPWTCCWRSSRHWVYCSDWSHRHLASRYRWLTHIARFFFALFAFTDRGQSDVLRRRRRAHRYFRAFRRDGLATADAARPRISIPKRPRREIIGNTFALDIGRDVQQPQQQKERHHRRHEVGIGDFPCAAVMSGVATALPLAANDDDGWFVADQPSVHPKLLGREAPPLLLQPR